MGWTPSSRWRVRALPIFTSSPGAALPATPRYRLGGHLARSGRQWNLTRIRGLLGQSDIAGDMTLDRTQPVAMLRGTLSSRVMDFEDLAPLVGLQARAQRAAADRTAPGARVLPVATLDLERLKMMNADVRFQAARIAHVKALPLERAQVHVRLTDGVLLLDPLQLGVAGGTLAGRLQISANTRPAGVAVRLDARALQLNHLFPTVPALRSSLGLLHGLVDLRGSGNSVAQMLGAASGTCRWPWARARSATCCWNTWGSTGEDLQVHVARRPQRGAALRGRGI